MRNAFKSLLLAFIIMFAGAVAYAQVTTSAISGRVADLNGEPVVGAAVLAQHEPSGTIYGAVTNAEGIYTIQGMRTGGPYKVDFSCLGYQDATYTGVVLQLAETYSLNARLADDTEMLEATVVVADAASKFNAQERTGAVTNISNDQILALPTVNRSITDVTRLSPYGGNGMSFAGSDGRLANFTVDGANFNNNFGLSDNLPGGGNPISIDALEELQVVISPYDVRQTNFIGGGVNAITKSGTNTFRGTAYVYHKNENMQGDAIDGEQITGARNIDRKTTYGFTFGGPIIKNKLFFFVNAEFIKIPTVVNRWRGSTDGVADADNYISRTTLQDLQDVSDYVASKYHYNTGSWTDFPADEDNYKVMARLDWNISQRHHLAVRYNYTLNRYWQSPNATSMDGGTRMANARMSQYSMSFANSMYSMKNMVNTWSVDLNSRLTNDLSNQFLATFSKLDDVRGSNSAEFPFIDITRDDDNYMALGYELFTWNNAVHNTVANVKDDLTYYMGAHKITGGLSFEYQLADNQYMRNGAGYYRYNWDTPTDGKPMQTVAELFNSAPEVVCLTYGYDKTGSGIPEFAPAARVQFYKAGIYAQDEWSVTDRFKLTYGARLDGLFFDNKDLLTNAAIQELSYYPRKYNFQETHIDTGRWPKSSITFSPRVGFNWDVFGNRRLKVRGGTGLFSGRLPLVFFTNMPTNGGLVQYQAAISGNTKIYDGAKNEVVKGWENYTGAYTTDPKTGNRYIDMSQFAGLVTDANGNPTINALYQKLVGMGFPTTVSPEDGTVPSGGINAVDPNFRMPQVWKSSLAVEYTFPVSFPLTFTAEGIFNKTINAVSISDWSIKDVGGFARFNGPDNRPIYPKSFRNGTKAFVLENTDQGYGWSASVGLSASTPDRSLDFSASYTHTVSKEITGMPGSNAESAFTYVPTTEGPNYIKLHNSQYVTPDRIIASLTHHDKSGNHYTLIYESWRGGYKYSYMMANDMNGDGYNYDAIYIPTDAQVEKGEFRFVSPDDARRFMDYVHNEPYLSSHQGEYAEPYSLYSPWVHRFDISYKHDFKLKIGCTTNTLQLSVDIKNVLNLFNNSWGVSKYLNPALGSDPRILKYEGVDADGYPTFSTPAAVSGSLQTFTPNHSLGQCWYASIGVKYMFN
ncbi:MAG: TonB-dependent receptor [Bacteroidales bacterium]|nr:TonB-dependent receptor [Bacteroidales bacterium]